MIFNSEVILEGDFQSNDLSSIVPDVNVEVVDFTVETVFTEGLSGKNGNTPYIGENDNWWIAGIDTEVNAHGIKGDKGDPFLYEDFTPEQLEALKVKGDPGCGIASIELTNTTGKVKTYTITFTDDTTTTFTVIDGNDGDDGRGISGTSYNAATGVLTITYTDNTTYSTGDLRGATGKSQYQSYLDTTSDNPPMTEQAWANQLGNINAALEALLALQL